MCHLLGSCWAETTLLNQRPHSSDSRDLGFSSVETCQDEEEVVGGEGVGVEVLCGVRT